jgi:hypothetical protein
MRCERYWILKKRSGRRWRVFPLCFLRFCSFSTGRRHSFQSSYAEVLRGFIFLVYTEVGALNSTMM